MPFHVQNPNYRELATHLFTEAAFVNHLGIRLVDCGPGWCKTAMSVEPFHLQQNGFIHAGVQTTIADHTAGAAAATLVAPDESILSLEFKINLLRPARGKELHSFSEVLKAGRRFSVLDATVFAISGEQETLVSKATLTMAVVRAPED